MARYAPQLREQSESNIGTVALPSTPSNGASTRNFDEQRRDQRHITILRVALIRTKGRSELCLIRNISAGGLMAHIYSSIAIGENIEVEFRDGTMISGNVRWSREEAIGVAFDQSISVEAFLAVAPLFDNGKKPRAPRIDISGQAIVRRQDGSFGIAQLLDISQGGLKINATESFKVGEHLVIEIPGFGAIASTLCWRSDTLAGISFVKPISYPKLTHWLKQLNG